MQAPFDNIVQHLFHQPSLLSVTVDELERMAEQHPYFAAAHFLLLKKMQDTDHPQFGTQLHKTTLYFNNPLWLQFLLQPETTTHFRVLERSPFIADEAPEAVVIEEKETGHMEEHAATISQPATDTAVNEEQDQPVTTVNGAPHEHTFHAIVDATPAAGTTEQATEVFNEPEDVQETGAITTETSTAGEEAAPPVTEAWTYTDEVTSLDENLTAENMETAVPPEIMVTEAGLSPAGTVEGMETESSSTPVQPAETAPVAGTMETYHADPPVAASAAADEPAPDILATTGSIHEEAIEVNTDVAEHPAPAGNLVQNDDALIPEQDAAGPAGKDEKPLFKTVIETFDAQKDVLFEPFHTVDYFASQGIKLSKAEADSKDKLGRQLKSFTEWLKSMKKLPQVSIDKMLSQNEESKVVEDAIHSIENKEVITEAMAEVFEKQGLTDKAAEVYQKLSLLNPGKSAYFAAKIDLLKH